MPTLVQSKSAAGTSLTLTSATTAGNCLVVKVADFTVLGSPAVTAVKLGGSADNFGTSGAVTASNSGGCLATIWVDPSCAGGQTVITVTETGGTSPVIYAEEWSGVQASSPVDQTHSGTGSSTAFSSGATGATSAATEVITGAAVTDNRAPTGPGAPWTNSAVTSGTTDAISGEQVSTGTGTFTYSGTIALSTAWAAVIATLLPAPSGPAVAPFYPLRFPLARMRLAVRPVYARGGAGVPVTPPVITHAPAAHGPVTPPRPPRPRRPAVQGARGAPVTLPAATFYPADHPLGRPRLAVRAVFARGGSGVPVTPPVITHAAPAAGPLAPPRPPRPRRASAQGSAAPPARQPAPFYPARRPLYPVRPQRRVRVSGHGSAGAPVTPPARALLISLASQAGTDDYGNAYPQGILATAGVIEGPVVKGPDWIIDSTGAYFYSGTPAAGNLIASVTSAAGTDPYGNATQAGFTAYDNSNSTWAQLSSGAVAFANGAVISNALATTLTINNVGAAIEVLQSGTINLSGNPVNANGNNLVGLFGNLDPSGYPIPSGSSLNAVISTVNSTISILKAIGIFQ